MGVYIKGMKMPESCKECQFTYWDVTYEGGVELCCDKVLEPCSKATCPLVEVPTPHGRLIDAKYQGLLCFAPTVIESEGE